MHTSLTMMVISIIIIVIIYYLYFMILLLLLLLQKPLFSLFFISLNFIVLNIIYIVYKRKLELCSKLKAAYLIYNLS